MGKTNFILEEEPFKMLPLGKAPKADQNTVIILYRESLGIEKGIVIEPDKTVLSSSIRMGKYDKRIVLDTSVRRLEMRSKIKTQEQYCYFLVESRIDYSIKDAKYVAKHVLTNIENDIEISVRKFWDGLQEQFCMDEDVAVKRKLEELAVVLAEEYTFLYFSIYNTAELDEAGQKVLRSNVETITDSVVLENETEIKNISIQKEGELERTKYREAQKTYEEKMKLNDAKMENLLKLKKVYGKDALLLNGFLDNEMNSIELNERIRQQEKEDRERKLTEFRELFDMGALNEETIDQYVNQTVFSMPADSISVEEKSDFKIEEKEDIILEDKDEIGNFEDDMQ